MNVRDSFESLKAISATDDQWPSKLWKSVSSIEAVQPTLVALQRGHVYMGPFSI